MLNYHSSIKKEKSYSGLTVKEISPLMKLNLRGKSKEFLSTIGKNINMVLPTEANTSSASDSYTSLWLSPDEWLVVTNNTVDKEDNNYQIEELLFNKISKNNLGAVVQTILHQIDIIIYLKEINTVNLFVRRSYSEHLMSWIDDTASRL